MVTLIDRLDLLIRIETKLAEKKLKMLEDRLKSLNNRFDMNNLSWMFGGMLLQRFGLSILRFVVPSMSELEKINDKAARKTLGLYAAFEFLKVSIFETLANSPLFQKFIEGMVDFFINVSEFVQTHPKIVDIATKIGVIATALGTLAIAKGAFGQIEYLMTLLGLSTKTGKLKAGKGLIGGLEKLRDMLALGMVLDITYDGIKGLIDGDLGKTLDAVLLNVVFWNPQTRAFTIPLYIVMKVLDANDTTITEQATSFIGKLWAKMKEFGKNPMSIFGVGEEDMGIAKSLKLATEKTDEYGNVIGYVMDGQVIPSLEKGGKGINSNLINPFNMFKNQVDTWSPKEIVIPFRYQQVGGTPSGLSGGSSGQSRTGSVTGSRPRSELASFLQG